MGTNNCDYLIITNSYVMKLIIARINNCDFNPNRNNIDECYHPGLFACTVAILTHGKLLWSINNNYLAHQNSKF